MGEAFVVAGIGVSERTSFKAFSERIGLSMDTSNVTGESYGIIRDKTTLEGGTDGVNEENGFKVKRDILTIFEPLSKI